MEELGPIVIGAVLTWIVQFSKKHGKDPYVVLAILSLLGAAVYGMALQLWGAEYVANVSRWFVTMATTATAIFTWANGRLGLKKSSDM